MTLLQGGFAFVLMLGVLISVHEFGHFIAAKLCGVRVLKFSLGFGSPIGFGRFRLRWERGGTEYVVAWIPLGGFVKMLGENPGDEASPEAQATEQETLGAKPLWQKLFIVLAGPFMNLALPVVVFVGALWVGIERPAPVIGTVERGSPAERVGLLAGDEILSVNGEAVRFWGDLDDRIRAHPGERLDLRVRRDGREFPVEIDAALRPRLDEFRLVSDEGWVGLHHSRQAAVLGVPEADSPAARVGLRSGDTVTALGETEIEAWSEFTRVYAGAEGETVTFSVMPLGGEPEQTRRVAVPALGDVDALGVIPAAVPVLEVPEGRAAARAGLRPGDLILAVDGEPVGSFLSFMATVRASRGRPLVVTFAREGETQEVEIAAELRSVPSSTGIEEEAYQVGILASYDLRRVGAVVLERNRNPITAVARAVELTVETTEAYLRGVGKLVTGEISRRNIGGPIEIARQSHLALQAGWDRYIGLLVIISINLGILNLLPIPILDGGQGLIFLVEGVKRSPLSLRTREAVQYLGLVVLVTLMVFAFWNDLSRNWSHLVEWVRTSAGL